MIKVNAKRLLRSWIITVIIAAASSSMITAAFVKVDPVEAAEPIIIYKAADPIIIYEEVEVPAEDPEVIIEPVIQSLGEYTITAYCSCEICCGEWAKDRPDGIVYGSAGIELIQGVSIAASKDFDFGTVIIMDGEEYVVQDRPAEWIIERYDGKIIDLYFSDHDQALKFGKELKEVYLKEGVIE